MQSLQNIITAIIPQVRPCHDLVTTLVLMTYHSEATFVMFSK